MKKVKLFTLLLAVLVSFSLIAGCSAVDVSEVLTVNDVKVTGGEYRFYLAVMKEMIAAELEKSSAQEVNWDTDEIEGKKALEVAKQRTYDNIVENKASAQEAKSRGLSVSIEEKNTVSTSILQYFSGKDKEQVLKDCEISDEVFNGIVEDLTYSQKLSEDVYTNIIDQISEISDDELRAKYDSLLEETAAAGTIKANHILILFNKDDGTVRSEEEALSEAQRIKALITDDNFNELASQYSEDPGIESYPDGYEFVHEDGSLVAEFDNAATALEVGQVSEPVKTSYGYHIIKRVPVVGSFDDESVQSQLQNEIMGERYSAAYEELIDSLVEKATVVKNDDKYNKIK